MSKTAHIIDESSRWGSLLDEHWDKAVFQAMTGTTGLDYPLHMNKQRKQHDTHLLRKWGVQARDIQSIARLRNERVRPELNICHELERNETQSHQAKLQAI